MMIFHGEDQVQSRKAWTEARLNAVNTNKQIIDISGESLTVSELRSVMNSISLFGVENSIFIENFFVRRPSNDKKEVVSYLVGAIHESPLPNIVMWESRDVSVQVGAIHESPLPNKKFDLPKYIFKFLDSPSIELLHLCLKSQPVEMVFASLATRAHKQAKIAWIRDLLQIDYKIKTGTVPYDLVTALELWIHKL